MKNTLILLLCVVGLLSACDDSTDITVSVVNAAPDTSDQLANAATRYAIVQADTIRAGNAVVQNAVTLPAGAQLGQSRHPTVDQLKALGYISAQYALGGDVVISFEPANCEKASAVQPCTLLVTTSVKGTSTTTRVEG